MVRAARGKLYLRRLFGDAGRTGGLFLSVDGGQKWEKLSGKDPGQPNRLPRGE